MPSKAMTARSAYAGLGFQRPQFGDGFLERLVADIGHAVLDRIVEPFQPNFCFGRRLAQFSRMSGPALGPLLAAIVDDAQDLLRPLGVEQPFLQMCGDQVVQSLIGIDRPLHPVAPLPGGDGAGVATIAPEHSGAADDLGRRDLEIA